MCNHLYQVFVKHILFQSSLVVFFYAMPLLFVPKGRGFFLWKILDTNRTKIARLDKQKALQNKIFTVALIKILEMLITSMIKLLA